MVLRSAVRIMLLCLVALVSSSLRAETEPGGFHVHDLGAASPIYAKVVWSSGPALELRIVNFTAGLDEALRKRGDLARSCTTDFFWKRTDRITLEADETFELVGHGKIDIDICGEKFKGFSCDGLKCRKKSSHGKIADAFTIKSATVTLGLELQTRPDAVRLKVWLEDVNRFGDYLERKMKLDEPVLLDLPDDLRKIGSASIRRLTFMNFEGSDLILRFSVI